jgi:hypothetical protein
MKKSKTARRLPPTVLGPAGSSMIVSISPSVLCLVLIGCGTVCFVLGFWLNSTVSSRVVLNHYYTNRHFQDERRYSPCGKR